jgi:hypothetical protein
VCFPTPLSAACGCIGLMAGPSRPFPAEIREQGLFAQFGLLLPEGARQTGCRHACNQAYRVGTFATGTAPVFDRPLAPRYGSDLLSPWLLSLLQRGDMVCHAAPGGGWTGFASPASLPAAGSPLRVPSRLGMDLVAGWSRRKTGCVLVCAVATVTLWVTASAHGSKLPVRLTRPERGF